MEIYVKMSLISTFSFFLVFNHDFVIYINFTHDAFQAQTDDVTNEVTHRIFKTNF